MIFEVAYQTSVRTVPILNGDLTALTILTGATVICEKRGEKTHN